MNNPYKPGRIEWITFFVLMPVLNVVMNNLLFHDRMFDRDVLLYSYPVIFMYGFASWYMHIVVMHLLRLKFPSYEETRKRVVILLFSHVALTSSTLFLIFFTYGYTGFLGYEFDFNEARWCLAIGVLLTLTATTTWEGTYIYQLWKISMREKENLQKLNLQNEFETLKSQVNPHFLFNSLNSLSSLIQENPEEAEKFLDEMSKVYRYILRNNKQELIDLETEVKVLQSFYHLLKTRYNEGFIMNLELNGNAREYFIPPLTLQLLLENAVKHNIISPERPLRVDVFLTEDDRLIVRNNLQKKSNLVSGNKVGLANIVAKFRLQNQLEVIIKESHDEFIVSIPLIK